MSSGIDDAHVIIDDVLARRTGHRPAGRLGMPHHNIKVRSTIEKTIELLVSFDCHCRGVKFYDLRSAGAAWGTELDLVKDSLCVAAWVPGVPGERA